MKTKLLLLLTMILSVININAQENAITVTSTLPTAIEQGQSITVDYSYTLAENATDQQIKIAINEVDENGGYITTIDGAHYSGGKGIAATTEAQTGSGTINIEASQVLSSALTSGHKYVFEIILQATASPWTIYASAAETGNEITINVATSVVNSLSYTVAAPTTGAKGETISLSVSYTAAQDGVIQFGLADTGSNDTSDQWLWNGWTVEASHNITTTTSTPVTATLSFTIPTDAALSSTLTGHHRYRILVDMKDSGYTTTYTSAAQVDPFTVAGVAGLKDINADGIVMYPNPVTDMIYIKSNKLDAKSIKINDIMGRTIRVFNNAQNLESIDVSGLNKGVYFLTTDTKKQFKFLKN